MLGLRWIVCASAFALGACSGGAKPSSSAPPDTTLRPPDTSLQDAAKSGDEGGGGGDAGSSDSSPGDAGDEGNGGDDGAADGSGDAGDEGGPPPDAGPPLCPTGASWSTATRLAISTAGDDQMGAITPDELTIAWTAVTGSVPSVLVADRALPSDPFGTPIVIPMGSGFYAAEKVALSPDGLRLVIVRMDYRAYGVITRASRSVAFAAAPTDGDLNLVNSSGINGELAVRLDDPLIGAHDQTFYYSTTGGGLLNTIVASSRPDNTSPWPNGTVLRATGNALQRSNTARRRPSGIAADDRTLFYWDEVDSLEKAAWRSWPTGTFDHLETLGAFRGAVPNANCDKLYYSAATAAGGGLDLYVASRQ